jgi:hypothetical protein
MALARRFGLNARGVDDLEGELVDGSDRRRSRVASLSRHGGLVEVTACFDEDEPGVTVLRSHGASSGGRLGRSAKLRYQLGWIAVRDFGNLNLPRAESRVGASNKCASNDRADRSRW